jgi:hypothetical protein
MSAATPSRSRPLSPDRRGAGQQRGQHVPQRVVGRVDLDVAVGADDEDRFEPGVTDEEVQRAQRRRVGPMQIVEHHERRARLRGGDEDRGQRVLDAEGRPVGGGRPVCRGALAEQHR